MKRVIILVLDGVGIGELPDAELFGDAGANTLGNLAEAVPNFALPSLQKLGLGNIAPLRGVPPSPRPRGAYGKLGEKSRGKDTTVGHWEIAGYIKSIPFPVYPRGFPADLIAGFERLIGRKTLGNKPASGTAILEELGEEHIETGYPIVYTSADSVFQVAAHEEVIPTEELYRICSLARGMLKGKHAVARVIARPFLGKPGEFARTPRRHDFSLPPPEETILDVLVRHGRRTLGIGKIHDIFAGKGISSSIPTKGNNEGINATIKAIENGGFSLIFINLVDFDMEFGHRRDPEGFARALSEFDARLGEILAALGDDDLLFICSDHGTDPTFTRHTDHTREYIPCLAVGRPVEPGAGIGTRTAFSDIAATVAEYLSVPSLPSGRSFWGLITKAKT